MVKPRPQFFLTLAVVVFLAYFLWEASSWRIQARLYPWVIGFPALALAITQLVLDLRGAPEIKDAGNAPIDFQFTKSADPARTRRQTLNIFSWIIGFVIGLWLFGFSLAIPLMVFLYLKAQSREPWLLSVMLTGAAWLLFWGLFDQLLHLPFPDGQLFTWLGLT